MCPQLFVTVKADMASVTMATAVIALVLVRTGCHMAVGAGGGGMACTTVGVGDSSMARTTAGAGDDKMVGIDRHTAVGACSEGACDGEMVGIDCHTAVGAGRVWPGRHGGFGTEIGIGDGDGIGGRRGEESHQVNTKRLKHSFGGDGC